MKFINYALTLTGTSFIKLQFVCKSCFGLQFTGCYQNR